VNTTVRTFETFTFGPVTEIDFSSAGGTPNPGLSAVGSGWQFGMDNLTTTVPEPGTLILFGLAGLYLAIACRLGRRVTH
jgi:hypothetical protein